MHIGAATACSSATTSRPERGRDMGGPSELRTRKRGRRDFINERSRSTAAQRARCAPSPADARVGRGKRNRAQRCIAPILCLPPPCPSSRSRMFSTSADQYSGRPRVYPRSAASGGGDAGPARLPPVEQSERASPAAPALLFSCRTATPSFSLRRMARIAIIALMLLAAVPARAEPAQPEAPPPASPRRRRHQRRRRILPQHRRRPPRRRSRTPRPRRPPPRVRRRTRTCATPCA